MHPVSRAIFVGFVLTLLACAMPRPAAAIVVECIEASKYKYLWHIFGNNPGKLAQYLETDSAKLPGPEFCRVLARRPMYLIVPRLPAFCRPVGG
jgi:hypothetical protein